MAEVVSLDEARVRRRRAPEELLSKASVAAHYDVSVKTVYRWIKRGCPAERLYGDRGPWRFRLSEVDRWRHSGA